MESTFWVGVIGCSMQKISGTLPMSESVAEAFVIRLLREQGPLSTVQIEKLARKQRKRCPDQTVIFLTKMKKKGLIKGEVSLERRGWIWWVP
jgi:hypothetical protein